MEKRKKCYISVPMKGRTDIEIANDFNEAEKRLRAKGYEPVSPWNTDVNPDFTQPLPVLMGNDIRALLECEAFCYIGKQDELPKHCGCSLEYEAAMIYGKEMVKL